MNDHQMMRIASLQKRLAYAQKVASLQEDQEEHLEEDHFENHEAGSRGRQRGQKAQKLPYNHPYPPGIRKMFNTIARNKGARNVAKFVSDLAYYNTRYPI